MVDADFNKLLETAPPNQNITKYLMVTRDKLKQYKRIMVSYSGGSDSDTILDLIELVKPEQCGEIKYVFFNTGLEYDATHRHRKEVAEKYGVEIEVHKPKVSIPLACKNYGVPFFSKDVSDKISRLQKHNFKWEDFSYKVLLKAYSLIESTIQWWCNVKKSFNIDEHYGLKEFMTNNKPDFKISKMCCKYAKEDVSKKFIKDFCPDLIVNGMRKAEGGLRAMGSVKSCFSESTDKKDYAEYRPLWFWSDKDKLEYKQWRNLRYSDCYEVWGFTRTGCVGCPFNSKAEQELAIAQEYEPQKVKAAYAVFGKSYEYKRQYIEFKENMKQEAKHDPQQIQINF